MRVSHNVNEYSYGLGLNFLSTIYALRLRRKTNRFYCKSKKTTRRFLRRLKEKIEKPFVTCMFLLLLLNPQRYEGTADKDEALEIGQLATPWTGSPNRGKVAKLSVAGLEVVIEVEFLKNLRRKESVQLDRRWQ